MPLALATALLAGSASASAATTAIDFEDPPAGFGGCEPNCERWTLTAAGDLTTTASQVSVTVGFLGTGRETSHMRLMPATRPARRSSSTRPTSPRARRSPAA
ncbi:hypothetical protein PAI11_15610 [Patulibacter medicamentivorans]|uniref:Uncharacterized protein n=1 Tax=Patulibacter medicamentivorans TaxID=1097667 RepID=H0E435_9ACTN|nr:hypothetical protein [Patulibacter medicamentivorans]EHN11570.1 hypothetical protein PAI11_15610 [Patulibacter medicamentivorans]